MSSSVAVYYYILQLLLLLLVAADPEDGVESSSYSAAAAGGQDLVVATEEMRRANYFTFVMLLNMVMVDQDPSAANNVTFLMPNDRILSRITFRNQQDEQSSSWSVREFLLRHSIPSPLLFDHLWHFPSGSTIPSSRPGYVLHVHNGQQQGSNSSKWWRLRNGRRGNFSLNNVRIISPNICTSPASSIRCHGIDGMFPLQPIFPPNDHCGPKPTAPSDHHHDNDVIAPTPAPFTTHVDPKEASPSSSHTSSSWSCSASSASQLLVLILVVFL